MFVFVLFFPSVVTVTEPGNVTQIQPVISDGKSPTQHHDGQKYQLLLGELLLPNTNINKPRNHEYHILLYIKIDFLM